MLKTRIAVLVSGGGTNLQAIIDYRDKGKLISGDIVLVVSDNPEAFALKRAEQNGIAHEVVNRKNYANRDLFEDKLLETLKSYDIEMIVMAGFMRILSGKFVSNYPKRILNVHPSLIPAFCGDGYYGLKVHQAALDYGVKVSGATVHYANEVTDGGKIIMQKAVEISEDETPESLQKKIMENVEWIILPEATEKVAKEIMENKENEQL